MPLSSNTLRVQVDTPIWEWCRVAPAVSSAVSAACTADNGLFHANHGRYLYFLISATGFWRYDTWTDTYQQLANPPIAVGTWSSMRFAGSQGYEQRVISCPANNQLQVALPFGKLGKDFDVRVIGGTGQGQRRIITDIADPVIADLGSATAGATTTLTDTNKNWAINQWVGYNVRITVGTGAGQVRKILYNSATVLTIADVNKYPENTSVNTLWTAPAAGSIYQIESSVLTVDTNWGVNPDATSRILIESGGIYLASSQGTSFNSLQYYDILSDTWQIKTSSSTIIPVVGTDGTLERCTENSSIWARGTATAGTTTTLSDSTKNWTTNQWVGYYVRIYTGTAEGQLRVISANTATQLTWVSVGTAPDTTSQYLIVGYDAGTASTGSVAEATDAASVTASILGNVMTVSAVGSGALIPGMRLSGAGVNAIRLFTGASSSGAVVTVASTTNVQVGMVMTMITGTGTLAAGVTTVISVNSATTFTISQTPSVALSSATFVLGGGLGNQTLYTSGGGSSSGTTITVTSTSNLQVGMAPVVTAGTGTFVDGTIVTAVTNSTTFTVSVAPSVGLSGATVYAVFPLNTILGDQLTGSAGSTGTYLVYPYQTVSSTTITGDGVATLYDSTKTTWTTNRWNGLAVRITGGAGKGQVRSIVASQSQYLSVKPDWTTVPDDTSTYEIQGDPDKMFLMLGANASVYLYNSQIDLLSLGRAVAWGNAAGVTATYSDHLPHAVSSGSYSNPTMTITTVNPHNFKTGMTVTIAGDTGAGKALNNISATITVTGANTFTYSVGAGSASITVPAQSTSTLVDSSKNWVPNEWAGHIVTYNSAAVAQATGIATVYSEFIVGNSNTTLFFARAGTAPVQGITRYVITGHFAHTTKSAVGAMYAGLAVGTQSTTALQDTLKGFTSVATSCSSSSTTVTTTGNLKGLCVGMYVNVTGGTGSFTWPTKVATLISDTQFTVDTAPATALSSATVTGTFLPVGSLNGRRARIIAGAGMHQEWALTGSTINSGTMAAITTAPVTGSSAYVIISIPARSTGMTLSWCSGVTDTSKKGSWLIVPRGGVSQIWDRLNIQTDTWELMHISPMTETLTTGSMYCYDGMDRIYFTKDASLRVYYLDVVKNMIHGAGYYPYLAGTATIGNRMEIIETMDGLKYLWLNRHSNVECFKQLLFY